MTLEDVVKKCNEFGAYKASMIDVNEISFDESLRSYCEVNYCGSYGKNYACPPNIGDAKEVIAKAKSYRKALVFQTVTEIEDSYDFEGMKEAAKRHSKVASLIDTELKKNTAATFS
jgi:predicted metal-binding protein